jgi:uncharacterized repeat protein (TIGR01451 family)
MLGQLVGIPSGAEPAVSVVASESQVVVLDHPICPAAYGRISSDDPLLREVGSALEWTVEQDPTVYGSNTFWPAEPVALGQLGFVRNQPVAQLQFAPIQYNPASREIRYNTNVIVEIRFGDTTALPVTASQSITAGLDDSYEDFLRESLLNYTEARAWRTTPDLSKRQALEQPQTTPPPGVEAIRVETKESGIYAVTFDELQAAAPGLDMGSIDPQNLHLVNRGSEIAIEVQQATAGPFSSGDRIIFYAEAIDTRYTDLNVYWLYWDNQIGKRTVPVDGTPIGAGTVPTHFVTTRRIEEDHLYSATYISADGDNWFWERLGPSTSPISGTYGFDLPSVASRPLTATLVGWLRGRAAYLNHSVDIRINNRTVYAATWARSKDHVFTTTFPITYLHAGANHIVVTAAVDNVIDDLYVNRFVLTYGSAYTASNDLLRFEADNPGLWAYNLSGFSTDTVGIWEITDPLSATVITGAQAQQNSQSYDVSFEQDVPTEHRYLALAPALVMAPSSLTHDAPSDLGNPSNGADYIVIAPAEFVSAADALASYRAIQGLRTYVVDVQDIYDEFSYGITDAEAIRSFLSYAYTSWTPPAPLYVVLMGDGNLDPKDNYGYGEQPSYIPPYFEDVDPWIHVTAADNRYVTVSGADTLPDMHLGRLPVNSPDEAMAVVSKIIGYEQGGQGGAWQSRMLFVADKYDPGAGDFAALSDLVADHYVPDPYSVTKLYQGITHPTAEEMQVAITSTINEGQLIVNYVGHGAVFFWGTERLLWTEHLDTLANVGKLPFFVPMTCLEGYYIWTNPPGKDYSALGEALVRLPDTGAIASWSPTGQGFATGHDFLNKGLFEALFYEGITELGPATTYAKLYLASRTPYFHDLIDTYVLLGDPATRLNVLPDLAVDTRVSDLRTSYSAGDRVTYTLSYTNAGPSTAGDVTLFDVTVPALVTETITSSGMTATLRLGSQHIWDIADLPAGTGGTITVSGILPESFAGKLTNTTEITTTSRDKNPSNNTDGFIVPSVVYLPLILRSSAGVP